jgi:hypothetical protein
MIVWPIEPSNKKYASWYLKLIEKAKNRVYPRNTYGETHHIIPRCIGGQDNKENLVKLSAREHYIAHALLWKMKFPGKYHSKMTYAFNTFIHGFKNEEHTGYTFSSKMYESFKKDLALQISLCQSGEGNPFYGKKHTEESRRIIGEKSKLKEFKSGPDNPMYGRKIPEETRKKMGEKSRQFWADEENKKLMLEKRKKYWESEEGKAAAKEFGDKNRGVKLSAERVEKTASKKRGKKAHEIFSPEALANIAEGRKHRVYKEETKKKMADIIREIGKRPKSEEHKRKIALAVKATKQRKKQEKLDDKSK